MKFRIFNKADYKTLESDEDDNEVCIMEDGVVYEVIPSNLFGEVFVSFERRDDLDFEIIE